MCVCGGGGGRGVAFVREDMQSLLSLPPCLSRMLSLFRFSPSPSPPPPEKRKQTKGLHRLLLRRPRRPRREDAPPDQGQAARRPPRHGALQLAPLGPRQLRQLPVRARAPAGGLLEFRRPLLEHVRELRKQQGAVKKERRRGGGGRGGGLEKRRERDREQFGCFVLPPLPRERLFLSVSFVLYSSAWEERNARFF